MDKLRVFSKNHVLFKSQEGHILCRINLEWTKYRGIISRSGYICMYSLSEYISHHLKKVTDYLYVKDIGCVFKQKNIL